MSRVSRETVQFVGSTAVAAVGVAIADGPVLSGRSVFALALMAVGVAGVSSLAADRSVAELRSTVRRWWVVAFVGFLPYALATAPASESAAAVGDAFDGPVAIVALEAVAGALVLGAVTLSVLYAFATQGIHPGAPTPEERILDEPLDD